MAARGTFAEGRLITRPPAYDEANYTFWKIQMLTFVEAQDLDLLDVIEKGPHVPCSVINGQKVIKTREQWTAEDKRLVRLDSRLKNMIISALGCDEFYRISNCKTAKEMWDTLEISHEGTEEVRRSRLNTLCQEYELFSMQPHEHIADMQKRFIHLINRLMTLGKEYSNEELNLKVLRSLARDWQPKVTAIAEKKSLSSLPLAVLFGKLQEHELELQRLDQYDFENNPMYICCLKASRQSAESTSSSSTTSSDSSSSSSSSSDEDQVDHLDHKLNKLMQKKMDKKINKKEASSSSILYYKCKKKGHYADECPNIKKKKKDSKEQQHRANLAWESSSESSFTSKNKHGALALSARLESESIGENQSDSEEVNSSNSSAFTDIHTVFEELNDKCLIFQKENLKSSSHTPKKKTRNATCAYCMNAGHYKSECHIRNNYMPCGKFKWMKKGSTLSSNVAGPKAVWVPKSL